MAVENDCTTSASKPAQAIGESAGRDAADAKESGTQQSASSIATATAAEDEEDMESKVERALACPCVADLRDGPCGEPFKEAFRCFMLSTDPVKGTDCIESFQALQACIAQHPEEFLEFLESGEGIDLAAAEKHAEDTRPAAAQQLQKQ